MSVSVLNRCSSDLLPTAPHSSPLPPVLTCVSLAFSAPSRAPPEMLSFFDALHEANASAAQPSSAVVQTRFVISLSHAYLDVNVKSADRTSVVSGKRVSVRVDLGVRRILKHTTHKHCTCVYYISLPNPSRPLLV